MTLPGLFFRSQPPMQPPPQTAVPPSAQSCTPCPTNCKQVVEPQTWFLHKEKKSDKDIPLVVLKKRMVCSSSLVPSCEIELKKVKQQF